MNSQSLTFDGIDLAGSLVLGWTLSDGRLEIYLELSVLPGHEEYTKPPPQQRGCFKRGQLLFPAVRHVVGLKAQQEVVPSGEEAGPDFDTFHCLRSLGREQFYVEGEFGEVQLTSDWPVLILLGGSTSRARPIEERPASTRGT